MLHLYQAPNTRDEQIIEILQTKGQNSYLKYTTAYIYSALRIIRVLVM